MSKSPVRLWKVMVLSLATLLGAGMGRAQAPDKQATQQVVVSGVGADADKALRNALRNAVEQVVGLILDAETLMKNENVIKDQILTYSDGYVEKFEKLRESKNADGLYEVKIKAEVKRRQVIEKLKSSSIYKAKVDGQSLFGEVVTQLEAGKNAAEMVAKAFEGLPLNLLEAKVLNQKPEILERNENGVTANWTVVFGYNQDAYIKTVLPKLDQTLSQVATRQGASLIVAPPKEFQGGDATIREPVFWTARKLNPFFPEAYLPLLPGRHAPSKGIYFAPAPIYYSGSGQQSWLERCATSLGDSPIQGFHLLLHQKLTRDGDLYFKAFTLDDKCLQPLLKTMLAQTRLRIALEGAQGTLVRERLYDLNSKDAPVITMTQQSSWNGFNPVTFRPSPNGTYDPYSDGFPGFVRPLAIQDANQKRVEFVLISPLLRIYYPYGSAVWTRGMSVDFSYTEKLTLEEMKQVQAITCSFVEAR